MRTLISTILLAMLVSFYATATRDYIMVMKDGTSQTEMEGVGDVMCDMSPELCVERATNYRTTTQLINTISGPMSETALDMAKQMSSVSYVEEDQIATRADAVVDISPPTPYKNIDPDISFIGDSRYYEEEELSAQTTDDENYTDRYNLDIIDEGCGQCTNRKYEPPASGVGVDVYILDTGIRYKHSEFEGRAKYGGYDAVDDLESQSQQGEDCNGHGTHCAGIAVGRVSGVAKDANVYSIRVLNCNSFGSFSGIIRGLDHVYTRHMQKLTLSTEEYRGSVVSMSLAGPVVQAANDAVCRLVAAGVVVVTASGNFRRDACNYSPGSAQCHINVGAHYYTERDTDTCIKDVYWFTSSSTSPGSNYGQCVHMMAPGQYVLSASYLDVNRHVSMSGTSMACPHVAGAAALLLEQNPRMTPARVKAILSADACSDINERRMPSNLVGRTPNRRLRLYKGSGVTPPTTTTPTTTTTSAPVPTTPAPEKCGTCPFDPLRNSIAEELIIESLEIPLNVLKEVMAVRLQSLLSNRKQILTKVSITYLGERVVYAMIYKKLPSINTYKYLFNSKNGIAYQDIDEEITSLNKNTNRVYFPKTIIPIGNNIVYVLADCESVCNDSEFRQSNYTEVPREILNPFTIDNLKGKKATFDLSISPNKKQVYVHNTVKTSPTCECYNYYNVQKSQLMSFAESIGGERKLVVQDIDALYNDSRLSFTVILCMPDCYVGSTCVNKVVNNPLMIDLNKNDLASMVNSAKRLEWEPIAIAPYFSETEVKHAVSFIRVQ